MKIEETSRIMYVSKATPDNNDEVVEDNKNSLTALHPVTYEPAENINATSCWKFDRNIPTVRIKNFESEKGKNNFSE